MLILFTTIKYPYGVRKHIRQEKARIRREFLDVEDRKHQFEKLYLKFQISDKKAEAVEKLKGIEKARKEIQSKIELKNAKGMNKSKAKSKNKKALR